jgi:hypothetical protein
MLVARVRREMYVIEGPAEPLAIYTCCTTRLGGVRAIDLTRAADGAPAPSAETPSARTPASGPLEILGAIWPAPRVAPAGCSDGLRMASSPRAAGASGLARHRPLASRTLTDSGACRSPRTQLETGERGGSAPCDRAAPHSWNRAIAPPAWVSARRSAT